jgi:SnoaL-like protein
MQEHEVRTLFERLRTAMDPAVEYQYRHEDYLVEFPQSGERMDRDGLRAMQEAYPGGPPEIRLRRLVGAGDLWVGESVVEYADGKVLHGVGILEFRDGKMWRDTRYWGEPFEAPAWRAQWVQPIDEPVTS